MFIDYLVTFPIVQSTPGDSFYLYKEARAIEAAEETAQVADKLSQELDNSSESTTATEEANSSSSTLSFTLTAILSVSFARFFY